MIYNYIHLTGSNCPFCPTSDSTPTPIPTTIHIPIPTLQHFDLRLIYAVAQLWISFIYTPLAVRLAKLSI